MSLLAIDYKHGQLKILNQLLLPEKSVYEEISSVEDGWQAIRAMKVRGAPAIAIVGALSVAVELVSKDFDTAKDLVDFVTDKLEYLKTARPTAVNIAEAANHLVRFVKSHVEQTNNVTEVKNKLLCEIEGMLEKDINDNMAIGRFGAENILKGTEENRVKVLTHCNTGSLATAGYGTALGVIRALHNVNKLDHVFCTETRPYNQGSRLTAYELVYEKIPATLITDSMVSMAMKEKGVSAVVVGADRVVSNGDTANKIGTYQLAIAAKYHNIPFYVAAPSTSIDLSLADGSAIVIEERPQEEVTLVKGLRIAASGIGCWNPAFDVTPAELITGGIITEQGVFKPAELAKNIRGK